MVSCNLNTVVTDSVLVCNLVSVVMDRDTCTTCPSWLGMFRYAACGHEYPLGLFRYAACGHECPLPLRLFRYAACGHECSKTTLIHTLSELSIPCVPFYFLFKHTAFQKIRNKDLARCWVRTKDLCVVCTPLYPSCYGGYLVVERATERLDCVRGYACHAIFEALVVFFSHYMDPGSFFCTSSVVCPPPGSK